MASVVQTTVCGKSGKSRPDKPEASLYWLAGIVDGEGTICVHFPGGNRRPTVRFAVYNTDWELLTTARNIVQNVIGRKVVILERTHLMPQSTRRQWQFAVTRRSSLIKLFEMLENKLIGKRRQLSCALNVLECDDVEKARELAKGIPYLNRHPTQPELEAVETGPAPTVS